MYILRLKNAYVRIIHSEHMFVKRWMQCIQLGNINFLFFIVFLGSYPISGVFFSSRPHFLGFFPSLHRCIFLVFFLYFPLFRCFFPFLSFDGPWRCVFSFCIARPCVPGSVSISSLYMAYLFSHRRTAAFPNLFSF